jgi:hypothetical protein
MRPDAAALVPGHAIPLRARQQAVLNAFVLLRHLTDEELCEHYHAWTRANPDGYPRQSDSGLRTRRAELVALGLLMNSGKKGRTQAGRPCIVWCLAPVPPGQQMELDV